MDVRATEGPVANEEGLRALGAEVDRSNRSRGSANGRASANGRSTAAGQARRGPGYTRSGRPKRWSTRRKLVTGLAAFLVLVLVLAGAGYGYLRYEWSQVKSIQCTQCTAAISGQPFNVLLVGSDSRAGDTGTEAQQFGSESQVGGERSDTIKVLHVDPSTGQAQLLSIPRDTYVTMSGLPASSGLTGAQKINTAFNDGPNALIQTVQNTLGIPISHFVIVDFTGLINGVSTLGGINLDFRYPVRDDDDGNNNSGLSISQTGCQTLTGQETLSLARSRYYEWYDNGEWQGPDPSYDIGRISRQNTIIEAMIKKAKGTYNPITLASFVDSMVHDITKDTNLSLSDMYDLAEKYHAFSPSSLKTYTLPTSPATTNYGSDVEVVNEPAAEETLEAFLGGAPKTPTTPPLDAYGNAIYVPPATTTTTSPPTTAKGSSAPSSSTTVTAPASALPVTEPYDPTVC